MREQVCVTKQRPCRRFSVVTYALAAFRYLATGIVALLLALLLVLLIVELGAAIGAVLTSKTYPLPAIAEQLSARARRLKRFFFGGRELRSASYIPELTLDW